MEALDRVGDYLNAFTGKVERGITKMFGSSNEHRVRNLGFVRDPKTGKDKITPGSLVDQINGLEESVKQLSDEELLRTTADFRERLANGETLDDLLPEAFARVRESAWRNLRMRQYDVQMVGGVILHRGMIAEMTTGEGKTLVATAPAFLNGLAGHVHVVTVNDYLARRDMEWMGPIFLGLGMTVDAIQSPMNAQERQRAYACDITYGTNNEFGFDYLRDNMKPRKELQVQGPLTYAIVDEIDNILIDEARTPLIISGPAHDDITKYSKADRIARQLKRDEDFEVKEKERTCHLTESGVRRAEELTGVESFYTAGNMEWPHLIDNSLKAHYLYRKDVEYVVEHDEIIIVDEHTGRKMEGRQWSDGLHQAVEAKEGVRVKPENQTLATITLQNFFKLYDKLSGMTGTAMTESDEFWKIYKLDVINVPTNRPSQRNNMPDVIFRTEKEKWAAVAEDAIEEHKKGRPVLVGTTSIESSELVSRKLNKKGIKHNVLNAKQQEKEAELIAQAGRKAAVTIATNMAGRGTDIILGGNPEYLAWEELRQTYETRLDVSKQEWDDLTAQIAEREGMKKEGRQVADLGGLHVIGTERHDSRRIDNQLRGRAGRQGDPGSSVFIVSLEDKLLRLFAGEWVQGVLSWAGLQDGEPIISGMVTRRIEGAQKKVEERHFDQRKHLLEYDEVMDDQRKQVYTFRQKILDGADCREIILEMIDRQVEKLVPHFLNPRYRWESLAAFASQQYRLDLESEQVKELEYEELVTFLKDECNAQADEYIGEQIEENLPEEEEERDWNWLALSKWANVHFGLNTNDRELKKVGRDDIHGYLRERSSQAIERYDFSVLQQFLVPDFNEQQLCGWLAQHFTMQLDPKSFEELSPEQAVESVRTKLREMYHDKEVQFPVAVGMTRFVPESAQSQQSDRDGLVRWANGRFKASFNAEQVKGKSRDQLQNLLQDASRQFYANGEVSERIDSLLEDAYGGHEGNGHTPKTDQMGELITWANEEFHATLTPEDVAALPKDAARQRLLMQYQAYYRPELAHAERSLLLELVDTAWKDHLYHMDHVRSGIGLVGYAQKDPKVEYKREGRRAFQAMWERIDEQVTGFIFRLEKESREFVGNLWQITEVSHANAEEAAPEPQPQQQYTESGGSQLEPGQEVKTVDPIVNRMEKVGRNDPCPCGSGKKYKKCHGAA
ncbi:preprotein translocase subunit SecA [Stratiformator vulcanicus]|uniref:Protein translocase subunit SecA n=1 Tax=Stratiformator vulcanicus TaxID=2527980 RepID=A0A517R6I0_9PLAN|nr:preprotein translocase subunit SecA [Stratiformator vulcanicus]QDT39488.1 preprotein translocase subunit SecA [Stratiformator vulcanicus]